MRRTIFLIFFVMLSLVRGDSFVGIDRKDSAKMDIKTDPFAYKKDLKNSRAEVGDVENLDRMSRESEGVEEKRFCLKAILQDSANIDDVWLKVGSKIDEYVLVKVADKCAFLEGKYGDRIELCVKNGGDFDIGIR